MANVKNNIKELFNVVVKESNQIIKIPKYTHFIYNKIEKNIIFAENKSKANKSVLSFFGYRSIKSIKSMRS